MAGQVRIFRSLDEVSSGFGPSALTIGNFDGVHSGHRHILRRLRRVAAERGLKPSALTFDPHPTTIVAPERAPRLMTTPEQRCRLMAEEGIQQALVLPFTAEVAAHAPEEFVKRILAGRLDARAVLVGENFRFGNKAAGNTQLLAELGEKYGFTTEIVPPVRFRGAMVSSSLIRQLLSSGNVSLSARLLERPYALLGPVVRGRGIGSKRTVPTLNLAAGDMLLPEAGVYITRTEDLESPRAWSSITNVGRRPTFGDSDEVTVETFLLDPLEGESPERIRVEFLRRLREERKFENPEALKAQILRDVGLARTYFRRLKKWTCQSDSPVGSMA